MLKVFLVEDEFVVREGIKKNVDWEANGFVFVGEASDGELALPMIQKEKPDIVITDIRMPFMDGLTLSKLLKKEFPWMEIIIFTGYGEFEYAKEAISIGVAQYILKPINSDELLRAMNSLSEKIMESRRERELREKYNRELEEGNMYADRQALLKDLVTGEKTAAQLLEAGANLHLDLSALAYQIALVKVQAVNRGYDEYSKRLVEAEHIMRELTESMDIISFDRGLEGWALLFKADSEEGLKHRMADLIEAMKERLQAYELIRYFAGVGIPVRRLTELPASFESASRAFAHRFLVKESMILDSRDLEEGTAFGGESVSGSLVVPAELDRDKVREFLKTGENDETAYFVREFFSNLGGSALKSVMFRQYIAMDAYFTVCDFLRSIKADFSEIEKPDEDASTLKDETTVQAYIGRIMEKAVDLRENTSGERYRDIVEEVKDYIEHNYADEELSLNTLASHVNFSPNHLSTIFSQQTGTTLIRYIIDFRMGKAKELLRCTSKKSSVICSEVGYKDPHYFSFLFKKTQGVTPTQYRNGETAGEKNE